MLKVFGIFPLVINIAIPQQNMVTFTQGAMHIKLMLHSWNDRLDLSKRLYL